MRITQNYSVQNLLRQVNRSRERISTLERDLSTGKRINQISDDPEQIESVLRFNKILKLNETFTGNLKNATDFMSISSQALDDATSIMAHVKELAIQGVDSTSDEEWSAYADQVNQALQELVDIANTRFKDRYVFGGTNTGQDPFVLAPDGSTVIANPNGIDGALKTEIGEHRVDQYNVTGQEVFLGNMDVFQTVIDLRDAFQNNDSTGVQSLIEDVDQASDQIVQANANLAAKINRYDTFTKQYETQNGKLQEILSGIQDTDVASAITELQQHETGLQTALQVLAKTLNISLVDYMG